MMGTLAIVACATFLVALVLTGQFRKYALAKGLLDTPNERSSHEQPTPRGGGVAIVIAALVALAALALLHVISANVAFGLITSGSIAAAIGYLDDRQEVSLLVRLAGQFAAAACAVWFLGALPVVRALPVPEAAIVIVAPLVVLYVVWMLNLTNFMDGIDGIASVEVISVCAGTAASLYAFSAGAPGAVGEDLLASALVIAAAVAGFLRWNWPPARIFMGDAGSGFLGVMLAALSLIAASVSAGLFWACVILCGVFVVDATVTLFRRIARRETFYHAHRSHAYQHASRRWDHKRVTIAVALINACWLLPWAFLAARGTLNGLVALSIAYIPLVALSVRMRAGMPE